MGVYRLNRYDERVRSHDHHHLVPFLLTMGFSLVNVSLHVRAMVDRKNIFTGNGIDPVGVYRLNRLGKTRQKS